MTEPTYEYIKGVGWVPNGDPNTIVVRNAHCQWKLMNRLPKAGELYAVFFKKDPQYNDNGYFNMRAYAEYLAASDIGDWIQRYYGGLPLNENAFYCTLEVTPL